MQGGAKDGWYNDDDGLFGPPPGEEGANHSHQGDEELLDIIVNGAKSKQYVLY